VQRAIGDYFKSHKRSSFFRVAHETLLDTKHTLCLRISCESEATSFSKPQVARVMSS
jgi:hypothetical protein